MKQVIVDSLMSRTVPTVTPDTYLMDVAHRMREEKVSCMVVVEACEPVGIVTERDMVSVLGEVLEEQRSRVARVKEFMSSPPITIMHDTPLFDALVLTQGQKIRHLPVVNEKNELSGILTYTDLAHAYEHIIEQQREIISHEINIENQRLREVNEQLQALSMEDALLSVGNRRAMEVDLAYTHNAATRYKREYSLVLFDVDCFKSYNDYYGHQAGDDVLKLVAEHIRCSIRKADRLYRYGGEELLLLLPETGVTGAKILAGRIVKELAERNIPHAKSQFNVLTMSGGIGSPDLEKEGTFEDWHHIIAQADRGLYFAKNNGRNQVCCIANVSSTEPQPASAPV